MFNVLSTVNPYWFFCTGQTPLHPCVGMDFWPWKIQQPHAFATKNTVRPQWPPSTIFNRSLSKTTTTNHNIIKAILTLCCHSGGVYPISGSNARGINPSKQKKCSFHPSTGMTAALTLPSMLSCSNLALILPLSHPKVLNGHWEGFTSLVLLLSLA